MSARWQPKDHTGSAARGDSVQVADEMTAARAQALLSPIRLDDGDEREAVTRLAGLWLRRRRGERAQDVAAVRDLLDALGLLGPAIERRRAREFATYRAEGWDVADAAELAALGPEAADACEAARVAALAGLGVLFGEAS